MPQFKIRAVRTIEPGDKPYYCQIDNEADDETEAINDVVGQIAFDGHYIIWVKNKQWEARAEIKIRSEDKAEMAYGRNDDGSFTLCPEAYVQLCRNMSHRYSPRGILLDGFFGELNEALRNVIAEKQGTEFEIKT